MKDESLKIKIVTFLMIAVPIIVISYVFIWENANERKTAEIEKNVTITKANAQLIEREVRERERLLTHLALLLGVQNSNLPGAHQVLETIIPQNGENYFVLDTAGNVLTSSKYGEKKLPNLKNNQYFAETLKGGVVVTPLDRSPFSGENVILIFAPIIRSEGMYGGAKTGGAIAVELPISFFQTIIDPVVIGRSGRVGLVDNMGNYIYDKQVDNKTKLVESACFRDANGRDVAIVERKSYRTGLITVFTMVRLQELGWYAIAFQPSADLSSPGLMVLTKNFIILALVIVTILALWRFKASLEYRNLLVKRQNTEKLALVGELAAGMAHEIRNPLTAIKGFSQLLKTKGKYSEDRDILELIDGSVDHIEGIVRETLLLAKPQRMKASPVDLRTLLDESYKLMRNEAVIKDITMQVHCGEGNSIVLGDRIHLKQVLVNIIKNAIEATPRNGQITLRLELTEKNSARITVKDTGVGIKSDDLEKLGTPFFTTKQSGTGLGLSVTKRIVDEHRGTMKIMSKYGTGTTVEIELPLYDGETGNNSG